MNGVNSDGEMQDKTVLVTGATSGIGFHTSLALASKGARVIITGRNVRRGLDAAGELEQHARGGRVEFLSADHSTVGGNLGLADRISEKVDRLDVLVNNVGGFYNDRRETDDGYEATLAVDFLGPFALTEGLLPALREGPSTRVVNVASAAYAMCKGDPFADIQSGGSYLGFLAYARSKLLKMLWTFGLARRLEASNVVANATNPGMAWTSGTQGIAPRGMPIPQRLFWPASRRVQRSRSASRAARSSILVASSPEAALVTGEYFESNAKPKRPSKLARDRNAQERATEVAAALVARAPTAQPGARVLGEERRSGR